MSISQLAGELIAPAIILAALIVIGVVVSRLMRDRWDLLIEHGRDSVRHALALLLMLGTLAGTVWTFSDGSLSVSGIWESLISVGGVAAALELGVIYCGIHIGELDQRILTARKADDRSRFVDQRDELMKWFYAIAAISAAANYLFRLQQLHSWWQAILPAVAPVVLVILFTIKLRPLPRDHAEIGRQSAQRGLVMMASQAQAVMMRSLRKMGRGHVLTDDERAQLAMALSFQRAYISGDQQQALDQIIATQAPPAGLIDAPAGAGATGGQWLTAKELQGLYGISERAAQVWVSQTPGRRHRPHSNAWEAPAATIYAAHGVPAVSGEIGAGESAPRRRTRRPAQESAGDPLIDATIAPSAAAGLQLAATIAQSGATNLAQEGYTQTT